MKLYQNRVKLTINGKEFTNNIPFPIKWNELLDNQLDEMSIELLQVQDRTFKPLSEVKVEIWNEGTPNNKIVNNYMVASDNANEIPSGSGKFNHSLSLIERTKWLERFICRSQGYVNPILKDYKVLEIKPILTKSRQGEGTPEDVDILYNFTAPHISGDFYIPGIRDLVTTWTEIDISYNYIKVYNNGNLVYEAYGANSLNSTTIFAVDGVLKIEYFWAEYDPGPIDWTDFYQAIYYISII